MKLSSLIVNSALLLTALVVQAEYKAIPKERFNDYKIALQADTAFKQACNSGEINASILRMNPNNTTIYMESEGKQPLLLLMQSPAFVTPDPVENLLERNSLYLTTTADSQKLVEGVLQYEFQKDVNLGTLADPKIVRQWFVRQQVQCKQK